MKYLLSLFLLCGTLAAQAPSLSLSITDAGTSNNASLLKPGKTYDADAVAQNNAQYPASPHIHGMVVQTFYNIVGDPIESFILNTDTTYWTGSFVPLGASATEGAVTSIVKFTAYWSTIAEPDVTLESSTSRQVDI